MMPLEQWICDVCGSVIEKPEDGYVVWGKDGTDKIDEIRIIHKNSYVNGNFEGCDNDLGYQKSLPLEAFLGDSGRARLLSLIDPGTVFDKECCEDIVDMRRFIEFFRRVQLPYYEEARLYWEKARANGYFAGVNEVWPYQPENLKSLIEEYSGNE